MSEKTPLEGNVSKIFKADGPGNWAGVPIEPYKKTTSHYKGITRRELIGSRGESTKFHVRYFEIEKDGFSTLEHHEHEHVVVVIRGRGAVALGCQTHDLNAGDVVYVSPDEPHQFLNPGHDEPFGFYCMVNAERDKPKELDGQPYCEVCG